MKWISEQMSYSLSVFGWTCVPFVVDALQLERGGPIGRQLDPVEYLEDIHNSETLRQVCGGVVRRRLVRRATRFPPCAHDPYMGGCTAFRHHLHIVGPTSLPEHRLPFGRIQRAARRYKPPSGSS